MIGYLSGRENVGRRRAPGRIDYDAVLRRDAGLRRKLHVRHHANGDQQRIEALGPLPPLTSSVAESAKPGAVVSSTLTSTPLWIVTPCSACAVSMSLARFAGSTRASTAGARSNTVTARPSC